VWNVSLFFIKKPISRKKAKRLRSIREINEKQIKFNEKQLKENRIKELLIDKYQNGRCTIEEICHELLHIGVQSFYNYLKKFDIELRGNIQHVPNPLVKNGMRFGDCWTVRCLSTKRSNSVSFLWICDCDCGRYIEKTAAAILGLGSVKISRDCGCLTHKNGGVLSWKFSIRAIKSVLEKQGYKCFRCGKICEWYFEGLKGYGKLIKKGTSFDLAHIIPKCEGGTFADDNLQIPCHDCHLEISKEEKRSRRVK
jgi:hypothetical protein